MGEYKEMGVENHPELNLLSQDRNTVFRFEGRPIIDVKGKAIPNLLVSQGSRGGSTVVRCSNLCWLYCETGHSKRCQLIGRGIPHMRLFETRFRQRIHVVIQCVSGLRSSHHDST